MNRELRSHLRLQTPARATSRRAGLVFGPVFHDVEPRGCQSWSGRCSAGDVLRVELRATRAVQLRVRVLDDELRGLAQTDVTDRVGALAVRIEHDGFHYVEIKNEGAERAHYSFVLRWERGDEAPGPQVIAPRRPVLDGLRRALALF